MNKRTDIVDKIKKLLVLSKDRSATEHEAKTAALAAQKLLAKYNINLESVDISKEEKEITGCLVSNKEYKGYIWAQTLAKAIARNYSCEAFMYGTSIVFYGYRTHTEVAKTVFMYLFSVGDHLALDVCREYTKKNGHSKGVYNSFTFGYVSGIRSVLDEQCVALKIIVPSDVTKFVHDNFVLTTQNRKAKISKQDAEIRSRGFDAGKEAISNRKSLAC